MKFKGYLGNFYNEIPYKMVEPFDEVYQFAADMGGAGYIFAGEHDAEVMQNSASINLNVLRVAEEMGRGSEKYPKIFYSSSACMYPEHNQLDPDNPDCREESAYPPTPTPNTVGKNSSVSGCISLIIGIMAFLLGLLATTISSDQKEPGKVEERKHQLQSAVKSLTSGAGWSNRGVGRWLQTRSFLFIDECIEATRRLMDSDFMGPVNIGSEEMVTINELVETAARVAGKEVRKMHKLDAPLGVRGRNSNNDLIREKLGWDYEQTLEEGIRKTYNWIKEQINKEVK